MSMATDMSSRREFLRWIATGVACDGGARMTAPLTLMATRARNGPQMIERGTLLSTISLDQLAASLGKWMGIGNGDLHIIFLNLGFFSPHDPGFFDT